MIGSAAAIVPAVTQAVVDGLNPWAAQESLLNVLGPASPERVGQRWSDADRSRPLAVKSRVDPDGTFSIGYVIG